MTAASQRIAYFQIACSTFAAAKFLPLIFDLLLLSEYALDESEHLRVEFFVLVCACNLDAVRRAHDAERAKRDAIFHSRYSDRMKQPVRSAHVHT
jgi:hypothetical protein